MRNNYEKGDKLLIICNKNHGSSNCYANIWFLNEGNL